jgi:hypothetical protein
LDLDEVEIVVGGVEEVVVVGIMGNGVDPAAVAMDAAA